MTPCPKYRAGETCRDAADCPIHRYIMEANCNDLTAGGIVMVREWFR